MGRRAFAVSVALFAACSMAGSSSGEMMPPMPGTAILYSSPNGRFTVKAVEPSGFSLREGDKVLWSEPFLDVSKAAVSDDGGPFGSPDKGAMKWVKRLVLSPDGKSH